MKIEEKTKEEVITLLKNQDLVLCYEDMGKDIGGEFTSDGKKEIRLLEIDGKLIGMIFSPTVMKFDLSGFEGKFNVRTDLIKSVAKWKERYWK